MYNTFDIINNQVTKSCLRWRRRRSL